MAFRKLAIGILVIFLVAVTIAGASASAPDARGAHSREQETAEVLPVWQQVNSNGFGDQDAGEVSALEAFNGYLYAGTHNPIDPEPLYDGAGIFRSPDGVTWTSVILPGFGNTHDIAPPAILDFIVFNNRLYASTGRGNASQIWRTQNGLIWAPMDVTGFSDPDNVDLTALAEFGGKLYAGVTNQVSGAQIWSSFTGDNNSWTKQTTPSVPEMVSSITGFAVFDGGLHAAVEFESDSPAQIWRSYGGTWTTIMNDGFGDSNTTMTGGVAVFAGYLYVGAGNSENGAQLWRTKDGTSWGQAITPAFSDSNNQKVEMVYVFQNQLYVSVKNTLTGIEIWRSADGALWERANLDGFGDSNNSSSNWSNGTAEFLSHLYVGTSNVVDGGELWRMQQLVADLALSKVDAFDPVIVGENITYTLTVSNNGPESAQNVMLTDDMPGSGIYVSATPGQGTSSQVGGVVTCNLGKILNGGNTSVEIVVTTTLAGSLTNNASVTADTADPDQDNNNDSETTTVDHLPGTPADLGVTMVGALDQITLGDNITYTITVNNSGPANAQNVVLTDNLPGTAIYVSATPGQGSCSQVGGVVTCNLGKILNGSSTSVEIVVTTTLEGSLTNNASVSADTPDTNQGNNSDSDTTTVMPVEPWSSRNIFLPQILKSSG